MTEPLTTLAPGAEEPSADKLAASAVTTDKIIANAVTTGKIGATPAPAPETTGDDGLAKLATGTVSVLPVTDAKLPAGLIPDKAYDILKWVAIIVLPALATFIVGLGGIWSWPIAGSVAATITAIGVLLGAVLGLSAIRYNTSK